MIKNLLDNDENKKDKLFKLSFREIRLEAKKLSIHLYSRKTKKELVELLFKDQRKLLIENKSNDDVVAEEDKLAIEKAKEEEDRLALEKVKAEEERIALGHVEHSIAQSNVYSSLSYSQSSARCTHVKFVLLGRSSSFYGEPNGLDRMSRKPAVIGQLFVCEDEVFVFRSASIIFTL